MADIHPTAIVEPGAELGDGVSIGPYCMVGADVVLGDGVRLVSHAVVAGSHERQRGDDGRDALGSLRDLHRRSPGVGQLAAQVAERNDRTEGR